MQNVFIYDGPGLPGTEPGSKMLVQERFLRALANVIAPQEDVAAIAGELSMQVFLS